MRVSKSFVSVLKWSLVILAIALAPILYIGPYIVLWIPDIVYNGPEEAAKGAWNSMLGNPGNTFVWIIILLIVLALVMLVGWFFSILNWKKRFFALVLIVIAEFFLLGTSAGGFFWEFGPAETMSYEWYGSDGFSFSMKHPAGWSAYNEVLPDEDGDGYYTEVFQLSRGVVFRYPGFNTGLEESDFERDNPDLGQYRSHLDTDVIVYGEGVPTNSYTAALDAATKFEEENPSAEALSWETGEFEGYCYKYDMTSEKWGEVTGNYKCFVQMRECGVCFNQGGEGKVYEFTVTNEHDRLRGYALGDGLVLREIFGSLKPKWN